MVPFPLGHVGAVGIGAQVVRVDEEVESVVVVPEFTEEELLRLVDDNVDTEAELEAVVVVLMLEKLTEDCEELTDDWKELNDNGEFVDEVTLPASDIELVVGCIDSVIVTGRLEVVLSDGELAARPLLGVSVVGETTEELETPPSAVVDVVAIETGPEPPPAELVGFVLKESAADPVLVVSMDEENVGADALPPFKLALCVCDVLLGLLEDWLEGDAVVALTGAEVEDNGPEFNPEPNKELEEAVRLPPAEPATVRVDVADSKAVVV